MNLDEYFEKWENETKTKDEKAKKIGKLYYSIYKFWNNVSVYGFRTGYAITHPWKILEYTWYEITYAWERVFKGYDCRVIWSIDSYLNEMMPIWLEQLKKDKQGVPGCLVDDDSEEALEKADKEFDMILDKISEGFKANVKMMDIVNPSDPEYKKQEKIWNEGMELFVKYYNTLWD